MDSKEYVRNFTQISVRKICDKLNIKMSNVSSGRTKKENYDKIKEEIEDNIARLYLKKGDKEDE